MPDTGELAKQAYTLQRDTAALLELLGGNDDDKDQFWGIWRGLTTPAVYRLAADHLSHMQMQVDQLQRSAAGLSEVARLVESEIAVPGR